MVTGLLETGSTVLHLSGRVCSKKTSFAACLPTCLLDRASRPGSVCRPPIAAASGFSPGIGHIPSSFRGLVLIDFLPRILFDLAACCGQRHTRARCSRGLPVFLCRVQSLPFHVSREICDLDCRLAFMQSGSPLPSS